MKTHPHLFAALLLIIFKLNAYAADEATSKFNNESEAGVVYVGGNSQTSAVNLKEKTDYTLGMNIFTNNAEYLKSDQNGVESARYWTLGLRYERTLSPWAGLFIQQLFEGNKYAGFNQRYSTNISPKFSLMKSDAFTLNLETGYQYRRENEVSNNVVLRSLSRIFVEAIRPFNPSVSAKITTEYLQSMTLWNDRYLNAEASINAAISSIFSVKTGYQVRYRQLKPATATQTTDTVFTTALVAKF